MGVLCRLLPATAAAALGFWQCRGDTLGHMGDVLLSLGNNLALLGVTSPTLLLCMKKWHPWHFFATILFLLHSGRDFVDVGVWLPVRSLKVMVHVVADYLGSGTRGIIGKVAWEGAVFTGC